MAQLSSLDGHNRQATIEELLVEKFSVRTVPRLYEEHQQTDWKGLMTDPTSRQRGRPTKTRQQLSENNLRTETNIWSQVPELARYLDILTGWSSVVKWLRLRLRLRLLASGRSCDRPTLRVSRFSLVPEQILGWYPNSMLHCMLPMQPSKR
jgi:hypothetical protein